jgi:hypothetical protein
MTWDTASTIINDAGIMLGLWSETVSNPYTSTDLLVVQIRQILKSAGRDLLREFEWSHLRKEYTFTTVNGTANYSLPSDFQRVVNQSEWNRTTRLPLGGPLMPQGWQFLKALQTVGTVQFFFRVDGDSIRMQPTPAQAATVALEYVSNYWVQPDGESAPTASEPTDADDSICLDSQMMVHRLRRDFLRAKGMDSAAASEDYDRALLRAMGNDGAAPVLSLTRQPLSLFQPLNTNANLPPTGYGQT